jgi:hypothetical protein
MWKSQNVQDISEMNLQYFHCLGKRSCGLLPASVGIKRLRADQSAKALYEHDVVTIRGNDRYNNAILSHNFAMTLICIVLKLPLNM